MIFRFIFLINIFRIDIIKSITDPEHPLTLEQLHVVEEDLIKIDNEKNTIDIYFTPTIPHCSLATIIGLSLRIKLIRSLPTRFKVSVEITPDTHVSRTGINKQLADKERIAAAIESGYLSEVINECISIPYEQTKLPSLHKLIKVDSELRTLILNTAITK